MRKNSPSNYSNDVHRPKRQIPYQRGNQRESSPHYVFLYSDDEIDNEEDENYSLKLFKNPQSNPRKVEVINVEVMSEDTLQALSLRYRCTISELKRINKIHNDNEIFARKFIKVPVKPYSLLTETKKTDSVVHDNHGTQLTYQEYSTLIIAPNDKITDSARADEVKSPVDINNIILNSTVEPTVHNHNYYDVSEDVGSSATDCLLTDQGSVIFSKNSNSNYILDSMKCSGADWGLSWFQLISLFLLFGFAVPIIYVFYIAESISKHESGK